MREMKGDGSGEAELLLNGSFPQRDIQSRTWKFGEKIAGGWMVGGKGKAKKKRGGKKREREKKRRCKSN
jgi:hypothetical protein